MRRTLLIAAAGALALCVLAMRLAGQDVKDASKVEKRAVVTRLPAHFGQLGLTQQQKETIYRFQAKYKTEIDELQAKIERLRSERDQALEAALTPDQKQRLAELRDRSKEKSKAKKQAKEAAAAKTADGSE